jgi:hypothetical protein
MNPCRHPGCHCQARERSSYCSDHCAELGGREEDRCHCGHPDCRHV